jgi:hypothetical protein
MEMKQMAEMIQKIMLRSTLAGPQRLYLVYIEGGHVLYRSLQCKLVAGF